MDPAGTAAAAASAVKNAASDFANAPASKQAEMIGDLLVEASVAKGLSSAKKGIKAAQLATVAEGPAVSPWSLGNFTRGRAIDKLLGGNLPGNFPTIDKLVDGVATSIKSMDLSATKFLDPDAITNVGQGYIDKVAQFNGRVWGDTAIGPGDFSSKGLDLAIPLGSGTPEQMSVLAGLIEYGNKVGVNVQIIGVP